MLLNITVENFRSYDKEQTLSLIADDEALYNFSQIGEFKVLKSVAIFGANASGKSNLIMAIQELQIIIAGDLSSRNYRPFFFNTNDTKISVDFTADDKIFTYTVCYNAQYISYECLLDVSENIIFERRYNKETKKYHYEIPKPEELLDEEQLKRTDSILETWQLTTTEKRLFLKQSVENNCWKLKDIMQIFSINAESIDTKSKNSKIFIRTNPYLFALPPISIKDFDFATNYYEEHDSGFELVTHAMQAIGATFSKIKLQKTPGGKQLISTYEIDGQQKDMNFITSESDGSVKIYNYFAWIKYIIESNSILIIDKLDTHFHPLLVEELVKQINNSDSKAQLIFTTHNPILLDRSIFLKEQIYFARKQKNKATELYSLANIANVGDKDNLVAKYLKGNFDAIPYFHSIDFGSDK